MKICENAVVTLEVKVYDADTNELLESTEELGPFQYIQGTGSYVPTIELELDGKSKGYKTTVNLTPMQGYGEYNEDDIETVDKSEFSDFADIYEGMEYITEYEDGSEVETKIIKIDGDEVTVDYNHPFAGKNLRFEIEVIGVREASPTELEHGHVHFHGFDDDCNCH